MKLGTRLSLLVGVIVSLLSISIGGFAILYSQNSEIKSVKSMLNASTRETIDSQEDEYVVALAVTESSPLPLSAALITKSAKLSYLVENSASIQAKPSTVQIQSALKSPVLFEKSFLIRTIKTEPNQYLIYSMSIKDAQDHSAALLHTLVIFVLIALLFSMTLTYVLFRRDSQLNELAKSLQRNNERMQEFLGDASHELRTPLTVIKGYAELLSNNPLSPDAGRYIQTMKTESNRMERLISELLLLAELGESTPHQSVDISLSDLIARKGQEMRDLFPTRNITMEITDTVIKTDPELIETLFTNIFSNIARHTPADAPVSMRFTNSRSEVSVIIEDGGPGISNLSNQAFARFDKSRSRESGGSGLGISIMQKIVETIGAKIEFSKSSLGGLGIKVTFPK